jgi:hypothetical protein
VQLEAEPVPTVVVGWLVSTACASAGSVRVVHEPLGFPAAQEPASPEDVASFDVAASLDVPASFDVVASLDDPASFEPLELPLPLEVEPELDALPLEPTPLDPLLEEPLLEDPSLDELAS